MIAASKLGKLGCYFILPLSLALPGMGLAAEEPDNMPLGVVATSDRVLVNDVVASAGTTLFSDDTVEAREGPAMVTINSGSRFELVKARVKFTREGDSLVIRPSSGLVRFNFKPHDNIRIVTDRWDLKSLEKKEDTIGSLVLNANGQIAMSLCTGRFAAAGAGSDLAVTPKKPLVVLEQTGEASLVKGGDTLTDPAKKWREDELAGKVVSVGEESHEILWNSEQELTIDESWQRDTGTYPYQIKEADSPSLPKIGVATAGVLGMILCMPMRTVALVTPAAATVAGSVVAFEVASKSLSARSK